MDLSLGSRGEGHVSLYLPRGGRSPPRAYGAAYQWGPRVPGNLVSSGVMLCRRRMALGHCAAPPALCFTARYCHAAHAPTYAVFVHARVVLPGRGGDGAVQARRAAALRRVEGAGRRWHRARDPLRRRGDFHWESGDFFSGKWWLSTGEWWPVDKEPVTLSVNLKY
eukprot:1461451-Rhodomonas_salina.1